MANPDLYLCGRNLSQIPKIKNVILGVMPRNFVLSLDDVLKITLMNRDQGKNLLRPGFVPGAGWICNGDCNQTPLNFEGYNLPLDVDQNILASCIGQFGRLLVDLTYSENQTEYHKPLVFVGLLGLVTNAKSLGLETVYFDIDSNQARMDKKTASSINIFVGNTSKTSRNFLQQEMLNELTKKQQMIRVRDELSRLINIGEVKTSNYDLHRDWPRHPLMMDLRKRIMPLVMEIIKTRPSIDPQDLIHQILFRLTIYSPRDIYGNAVLGRLKDDGVLENPERISRFNTLFLQGQSVNWDLIKNIVDEQVILAERRNSGKGSIYDNFNRKDLFTLDEEKRWNLHRREGKLFVRSPRGEERSVFFEVADNNLARVITKQHHYIHAARSRGYSFGLRVEGEDIPFAIETVEATTEAREIKQKAWLSKGFHPLRGFELTRLYTFPGGPKNVVGVLDRLVPEALLAEHPLTEFVSTTVMPTYALTRSTTIAAGIDDVALARIRPHKFFKRQFGETVYLEQATNRRLDGIDSEEEIITSNPEFPLLPALEVVKAVNKKSFSPILNEGEAIFIDER